MDRNFKIDITRKQRVEQKNIGVYKIGLIIMEWVTRKLEVKSGTMVLSADSDLFMQSMTRDKN